MNAMLSGRCLCGAVGYRCGPLLHPPTLCHCESCRRASGAPAVGWLTVKADDFVYTAGAVREYRSSPDVIRAFCGACGTPLTYRSARRPGEIDVTSCSLDEPMHAAPVDHIWMEDALAWDRPCDGLPQHASVRRD